MTKRQRENSAKYCYDMSKGIALLTVVGNLIKEEWDIPVVIFGFIEAVLFYIWGYIIDGGGDNRE